MDNNLNTYLIIRNKLLGKPLSTEVILNIIKYDRQGEYLHILKQYGIKYLETIKTFWEERENYEKCQQIKNTIDESRVYFGTKMEKE